MSSEATRDIALDARTSVRFAHRRLDGINGSLDGLRDDIGGVQVAIEGLRVRVLVISAVAAALGAAAASALTIHFATPQLVDPPRKAQPPAARGPARAPIGGADAADPKILAISHP